MAEQEWLRPGVPGEAAGAAWAGKRPAQFELRPLSLGEVLDRTFSLYKSKFWLFAGISMVAATVNTVGVAMSLTAAHRLAAHPRVMGGADMGVFLGGLRDATEAQAGTYLVMLLFVLVSAVTQAATALALTQVYLERPASAKEALRAVFPKWYRYIGIALWQGWSFLWASLVLAIPGLILLVLSTRSNAVGLAVIGGVLLFLAFFGGFPVGMILYLRNSLAVPASVSEGLTIRPAMRRSKLLAVGTKGRIFMVVLIAGVLLEIVAVLQAPVSFLILMAPNQQHYLAVGISLLITFVGHTVVGPVASIGLTLVYFDQRVRKEALDLQLLLEGARAGVSGGAGMMPGMAGATAYPPEGHGFHG